MKSVVTATFASCLLVACADDSTTPEPTPPASLLEIADRTPDLATLVAVVDFASESGDLATLLAEPGSLTVFAPTNAAFNALAVELTGNPNATAGALLVPENRPLLRSVLKYHVLTSEVRAANIPFGKAITTAEGSIFKIESGSTPKIVDGRNRTANIAAIDLTASNGVAHVIDRVILPANKNIVEIAAGIPDFSILVEAVTAVDLGPTLTQPGPFTVFAPTNDAFAALLDELKITKQQLFNNKALVTAVLKYHVVPARVLEAEAPIGAPVATVNGATFTIDANLRVTDGRQRIAQIMATDVFATNGVIHVLDTVILPPQ